VKRETITSSLKRYGRKKSSSPSKIHWIKLWTFLYNYRKKEHLFTHANDFKGAHYDMIIDLSKIIMPDLIESNAIKCTRTSFSG